MKKSFVVLVFTFVFALLSPSVRASVQSLDDAATAPLGVLPDTNLTYSGTTVGGPTFNRPLAGTPPTSLSGVGTAVAYSTFSFTAPTTGSYTFLSQSVTPANWDNYTFLYQTTFNPASPLTNALTGNDDNPTIGLSGFSYGLTAGTTYIFVTTGFSNTDAGTFNGTINAAVPEPGTFVWAAAMAGCFAARRLRRHAA